MNYDEFYEHVKSVFSEPSSYNKGEQYWYEGTPDYYELKHITSGESGGSCWGDEPSFFVNPDPEPELELLDTFLGTICPNIGFLQYKKIIADCVKNDTETQYEYYGNYANYSIRRIQFITLYKTLDEMDLL